MGSDHADENQGIASQLFPGAITEDTIPAFPGAKFNTQDVDICLSEKGDYRMSPLHAHSHQKERV